MTSSPTLGTIGKCRIPLVLEDRFREAMSATKPN